MVSESKRRACEHFSEGRKYYKLMQFEQALKHFQNALECDPEDGPSRVYVERCKHYIATPPDKDWDGVFEMQTK